MIRVVDFSKKYFSELGWWIRSITLLEKDVGRKDQANECFVPTCLFEKTKNGT